MNLLNIVNGLLLAYMILMAILTLIRTLRNPFYYSTGWIPVALGLLSFAAITFLLVPQAAGYLSAIAFLIFVILPSRALYKIERLQYEGDFENALRHLSRVRYLHPIFNWPWRVARLRAHQSAVNGELAQAVAILQQYTTQARTLSAVQEMEKFYLTRDWPGLIQWWRAHPHPEKLHKHPHIVGQYLRALGEIGDLNGMIEVFTQHRGTLAREPGTARYCALYLFAFCGYLDLTTRIMDAGILPYIGPDMRAIWLATAHLARGYEEESRVLVEPLLDARDCMIRILAQQRHADMLALANEILTPESRQRLSQLRQELYTAFRWHD